MLFLYLWVFSGSFLKPFLLGKILEDLPPSIPLLRSRFVLGHSATVTTLASSQQQALAASGQLCRAGAKYAEVPLGRDRMG